MKKAVIYARHLTYREYEPTIDEQIAICKKFAVENNFEIADYYLDCFDKKMFDYPAFENLTYICKSKRKNNPIEFDCVIIQSIPILGRNINKIKSWLNALYKKGIAVYLIANEELPYIPIYQLYKNIKKEMSKNENSSNLC